VVVALRTMDGALLSPDGVDALLAALPTPEEVAAVRAEDAPGVQWDRPEQLVLAVGRVEQAEARLRCWQLRATFQERFDSVSPPAYVALDTACLCGP
jgi:hypothetical protein